MVLAIGSVATLGLLVNVVAGGLLAFTIAFYVLIYTMWLKRRTPQNIVIGGAAGAFPPMIGWAAVTGSVSAESILLFLIIFMWTPPHFWALSLYRARDYSRAGVPMLPVVAGPDETRKQIVIYSALLVPLAIWPAFIDLGGAIYAWPRSVSAASSWRWPSTSITRARAAKATGPPSNCSASPSCICSCCSPCCCSSRASPTGRVELREASVMIEKFSDVSGIGWSEFLDLNHTGRTFVLVSLVLPKFARDASCEVWRTSEAGH
jgi:hypothetical protein